MPLILLANSNPYIPWDTSFFMKGVTKLTEEIGLIFNVCFWVFIGILGIVVLKNIVSYFFD